MTTRTYNSELREAQAAATRKKILDGLVEVMADGVDALSVPAVARRAGVSIGTVYRHFGNKAGLLAGLVPYAAERTGIETEKIPTNLDEMDAAVHAVFERLEDADDLIRAALASRVGREARLEATVTRLELIRRMFEQVDPSLREEQVEHLSRVVLILSSSDTYREWKERLGLTPEGIADEVMWTIRTLLKGLTS